MNLEEKARNYGKDNFYVISTQVSAEFGYKAGHNQCKSDLLQFLKSNPKASSASLIDHLEQMK